MSWDTILMVGKKGACRPAKKAFSKKFGEEAELKTVCEWCLEISHFNWITWLMQNIITNKKTAIKLAVFSAKLVLPIYEKEYPGDDRPRKAIEISEKYIDGDDNCGVYAAYAAASAANVAYATAYTAYTASAVADIFDFATDATYNTHYADSIATKITDYFCDLMEE